MSMIKLNQPLQIAVAWILLACFSLHLTGCYSKRMIPMERLRGEGDKQRQAESLIKDKVILLRMGERIGLLESPQITPEGLKGILHNPFQLDTVRAGLEWSSMETRITRQDHSPPPSQRIDIHLGDNNANVSLFSGNDSTTTVRQVSIPWQSVEGIYAYELSTGRTIAAAVGGTFGLLTLVGFIVVLSEASHWGNHCGLC